MPTAEYPTFVCSCCHQPLTLKAPPTERHSAFIFEHSEHTSCSWWYPIPAREPFLEACRTTSPSEQQAFADRLLNLLRSRHHILLGTLYEYLRQRKSMFDHALVISRLESDLQRELHSALGLPDPQPDPAGPNDGPADGPAGPPPDPA